MVLSGCDLVIFIQIHIIGLIPGGPIITTLLISTLFMQPGLVGSTSPARVYNSFIILNAWFEVKRHFMNM